MIKKRKENYTGVEEKNKIEKTANEKLTDHIKGEPKMMKCDCFTRKYPAFTYL